MLPVVLVLTLALTLSGCAGEAARGDGPTTTVTGAPGSTDAATPSVPRWTGPVTTPEAAADKAIARHASAATSAQHACVVDAFRSRPDLVTAVTDSPAPSLDEITSVVLLLITCDRAMVVSGFVASAPPEVTIEQKKCIHEALSGMSTTDLAQLVVMQSDAVNFASVMEECHVALPPDATGGSTPATVANG